MKVFRSLAVFLFQLSPCEKEMSAAGPKPKSHAKLFRFPNEQERGTDKSQTRRLSRLIAMQNAPDSDGSGQERPQ